MTTSKPGQRQGLFPLPMVQRGTLLDGSLHMAPLECSRCETRPCTQDPRIGRLLVCPLGVNAFRVDSQTTVCGFFHETYKPGHPESGDAQRAFKAARRRHRKQLEGGRSSNWVSDSTWKHHAAVLARWSSDHARAVSDQRKAEVNAALADHTKADHIRSILRNLAPGLDSSVHHDMSQLATAINSAAENILDLQYGSVSAALGWSRPPRVDHDELEVWRRQKAIFYFSDLLSLRLSLGPGVPDEAVLRDKASVAVHRMFMKIIEPYRLLANDRGISIRTRGESYGQTLAPYEPFLIPPLAVIDNAVKYSPNGGAITVTFRETSDTIEVDVASIGPTLDPGEEKAIFTAGHRGRAAVHLAEGQGLGLWLAATLLREWGGDISVDQQPSPSAPREMSKTTFSLHYSRFSRD